jgi:predicted phage terminase large subunit-like protein
MVIKVPKTAPKRELLVASPSYFIKEVYGYIIAPHHFNILEHFNKSQTTLDLAPRGSGKSRVGNIGYASWCVCNQPNARLLVLSDTDGHAVRFLSTIKNVLGTSPIIEEFYGKIQGEQWTDHQITTSLRTDRSITEASITALGMYSGAVTSGHYSHIFADDLNNFANTRTQGMRERGKTWWKTTVLPTLLPGGEIRGLGTRYHYDDLYKTFTKELGYDTQVQAAIIDPGTPKERSIWEAFMPLHSRVINGVLVKGLIEIRDGTLGGTDSGIGSLIFGLQYQNDTALQESGVIFRYDWFNFYDELPPGLRVYQGVDLAISKKDTADFFVILTLGIDNLGNVYILDIYKKRGVSFNDQRNLVIKKAEEWKPLRIGIETNAYQAVLAEEVKRITLLPIIELPTSKDKVLRAQMRSGLVESGRVYVRHNMHDFVSELTMFDADAEHDDQFDAFDFGLTVAENGVVEVIPSNYYVPEFDTPGEYT